MAMALVNACVEPVLIDNPNTATVPIHFRVLTSDVSLQTKAQVSGYEQAVNRLFMYCFDQNGKYLGRYETVKSNTDNTPGVTPVANQAAYDGSFYGKVPPATARIHFIANVDINVGNDKIGFSEEQVFHGSNADTWLLTVAKDAEVGYWGYLKASNPDALQTIFQSNNTIIYLLRDRACIQPRPLPVNFASMNPNINLSTLKWTVYNGMKYGFMAPYNGESDSPFENYYSLTETTLEPNSVLTQHSSGIRNVCENDAAYTAWDNDATNWRSFPASGATQANYLYAYEDLNQRDTDPNSTDPIKNMIRIIIKAEFKQGEDNNGQAIYKTLYFPICLSDDDGNQIMIQRGHEYAVTLDFLPEALGKATFKEAATAKAFSNGQLVSIPALVPEVSDGNFDLRITAKLGEDETTSTALLYQSLSQTIGGDGTIHIPFTFKRVNSNAQITPTDYNFTAKWETQGQTLAVPDSESDLSYINPRNIVYNPTTGEGYLIIKLKDNISSTLNQAVINLRETKHKLERNIYLYTITKFTFKSGPTLTAGNETTPPKLTFQLPDDYPKLLYPVKVQIASKTLRPTRAYSHFPNENTPLDVTFGVDVKSTDPTVVPGITIPTGDGDLEKEWNYQADHLWNFWYTFTINEKDDPDNLYTDTNENKYTIDFMDVRSYYPLQNISNIGLFLRIQFFGPSGTTGNAGEAIPVTPSS